MCQKGKKGETQKIKTTEKKVEKPIRMTGVKQRHGGRKSKEP